MEWLCALLKGPKDSEPDRRRPRVTAEEETTLWEEPVRPKEEDPLGNNNEELDRALALSLAEDAENPKGSKRVLLIRSSRQRGFTGYQAFHKVVHSWASKKFMTGCWKVLRVQKCHSIVQTNVLPSLYIYYGKEQLRGQRHWKGEFAPDEDAHVIGDCIMPCCSFCYVDAKKSIDVVRVLILHFLLAKYIYVKLKTCLQHVLRELPSSPVPAQHYWKLSVKKKVKGFFRRYPDAQTAFNADPEKWPIIWHLLVCSMDRNRIESASGAMLSFVRRPLSVAVPAANLLGIHLFQCPKVQTQLEKEQKRKEKEEAQMRKQQKKQQEEALREQKRREKEEAEMKKQQRKQEEEAWKERKHREKEEAEMRKRVNNKRSSKRRLTKNRNTVRRKVHNSRSFIYDTFLF
ncbi:hypothetical protein ABZP36_023388 [Zizania latifolia]